MSLKLYYELLTRSNLKYRNVINLSGLQNLKTNFSITSYHIDSTLIFDEIWGMFSFVIRFMNKVCETNCRFSHMNYFIYSIPNPSLTP